MRQFLILFYFLTLNCVVVHAATNGNVSLGKAMNFEKKSNSTLNDTIPSLKKYFEVSDCLESINLTDLEQHLSYLYWASNYISASDNYRINPGGDIKMKAGKTIVLKPNATVLRGSKYLARIEACEKACSYEIPKGISPNGDGLNDEFNLSDVCNLKNVKIFNRYGVEVFEKDDYKNEWHGQDFNGSELPSATYYYVAKLSNGDVRTGWVYLNR